jgi:hypothetical protein
MSDLTSIRTAAATLRARTDELEESFGRTALRLATDVFTGALGAEGAPVNPALAGDIAFAFNDVAAAADDLGNEGAAITPLIEALRTEIDSLKAEMALPAALLAAMRALQQKLRERRTAVERQTYVEEHTEPLPHPPEELGAEALPIRDQLAGFGFITPALDGLIEDPASLRFQTISEIVDEMDVIAGE